MAEEWYLDLRDRQFVSNAPKEKTFGKPRDPTPRCPSAGCNSRYAELLILRMNAHALPDFKEKPFSTISNGMLQSCRTKGAKKTIAKTTVKGKDGGRPFPANRPLRREHWAPRDRGAPTRLETLPKG